jgi:hypothetical protein
MPDLYIAQLLPKKGNYQDSMIITGEPPEITAFLKLITNR